MKYELDKNSGLKYISSLGAPENSSLVILHGFGANAQDLFPISQIDFIKNLNLNWYFLEAPLTSPEIEAFGGKSWFEVDIPYFQSLVAQGRFKEYYARSPKNIDVLHNQIFSFLNSKELQEENTILGGFSQGAMVSTDYLFSTKFKAKGLLHLSGTVIRESLWKKNSLKDIAIFQSHGRHDPVLPLQGALHFKELSGSASHKLEIFDGGHEIPYEILKKMSHFLKNLKR